MITETHNRVPVSEISQNDPHFSKEILPQSPNTLDEIVIAACTEFGTTPKKIFTKRPFGVIDEETDLAKDCVIYLLSISRIKNSIIARLFSVPLSKVSLSIADFKDFRSDPEIDIRVGKLEEEIPVVRESNDIDRTKRQIEDAVGSYPGVSWEEIIGNTINDKVNEARLIAAHLFLEAGLNGTEIIKIMRYADPSTICASARRMKKKKERDVRFNQIISILEDAVDVIKLKRELQNAVDAKLINIKTKSNGQGSSQMPSPL